MHPYGYGYEVTPAKEQPYGVEIRSTDDIFVKQMVIPKSGTIVPQHSHAYDHLSMLAVGSVRVWEDGEDKGVVKAPAGITIKSGVKHTFMSLEDNTIIYCIHNIARSGDVEILEEHQIIGESPCLGA